MNPWLLLGGAAFAMMALSKKGTAGKPQIITTAKIDLSIATPERFHAFNTPIGTYTHTKTNVTVSEYDHRTLTLGLKRGFEWAIPPLSPEPTKIDPSDQAIEAAKAAKLWASWSKWDTLCFLRGMKFGAVTFGISLHEGGGNPYAFLLNTNKTRDFGMCGLNETVIFDPSNWPKFWGQEIKKLGLYSAFCPWLNLGAACELLTFLDGGKDRLIADLLVRYAGWNQFLVTPHQPYDRTLALIAFANDLFK